MALQFELQLSDSCQASGDIFAIVHTLISDNDIRQINAHLGRQMSDVPERPYDIITRTVEVMEWDAVPAARRAGIMAVEVVKLCTADHAARRLRTGSLPPRLERLHALVLTRGIEPFDVVPFERPRGRTTVKRLNGDAPIPISATTFLSATRTEEKGMPIRRLVRSAPFAKDYRKGYVALRGFEKLYNADVRTDGKQV